MFDDLNDEQLQDLWFEALREPTMETFSLIEVEMVKRGLLAEA